MLEESDLIRGCKEFNEVAQRALYKKYAPVLKAICIRYVSDPEEAKDILQEGFIKIFSCIHSFSSKGSFEGWMKRIVVNAAISHYKKSKRHLFQKIEDEDISDEPSKNDDFFLDPVEEEYTKEELLDALDRVPELYRIVFNMFYLEEFSHKEIAESLNIDEKTSRTRLFRAKKILQTYMVKLKSEKGILEERRTK